MQLNDTVTVLLHKCMAKSFGYNTHNSDDRVEN